MSDARREPVPEQREAIDDRGRDLFLFAGAGSGKTTVLVERFCDAVCATEGPDAEVEVENVLAFTFTEKAAGELKRRIRGELQRRAGAEMDPARARVLRERAREAESAWISTIHAFCQRVLAAHPLAAGLDPRFRVLDAPAADRIAADAFDAAFERFGAVEGDDRMEMAAAFRPSALAEIVRTAHDELRSRGEDDPRLPELHAPDLPAALGRLHAAAADALRATEGATKGKAPEWRERMAAAAALELGGLEEERVAAFGFDSKAADFLCQEVAGYHAARQALERALVEERHLGHYEHLRELLVLFSQDYAERKHARSRLDFEDLQLATRRLLGRRADLRHRYQRQFAHLMVDEFQDTNQLQLDIVRQLHVEGASRPNRLFTVGDEFQSIYSFRHADVSVFRAERERAAAASDTDAGVRRLLGNFRSRPEVLGVVNALGRTLFEGYAELTVGADPPAPLRAPGSGPAVEVLVTEQDGWAEEEVRFEVSPDEQAQLWRVAEARFLAGRLRELADDGFPLGDMVILLRSFTYVEAYEQALDEAGLRPHVVGGRGYWSRQQVTDLRYLLACIANPLDDHAMFGVLSSPCCGIGSDALWLVRQAAGGGAVWGAVRDLWGPAAEGGGSGDEEWLERAREWAQHVPDEDAEALRGFVIAFLMLRERAPRLGLEPLIELAMTTLGYDLALLMRPGGTRRMANVRKLMRKAREFEADEGRDLRAFVDFIAGEEEASAKEGEAALEAESHGGVRLMTVHAAKGLEFPLVAVADLGRGLGTGFPPWLRVHPREPAEGEETGAMRVGLRLARLGRKGRRIFDYEELQDLADELASAEERRIFHVAMTRAEERLILSGACERDKLEADPRPLGPLMPRVLRALGSDGHEGTVEVPAPSPRAGLGASFGPIEVDVRVNEPLGATAEAVRRAAEKLPFASGDDLPAAADAQLPDPGMGLPAPETHAPAVGAVSYSALSLYERCGYRFYAERVLGMRRRAPTRRPRSQPAAGEQAAGATGDQWATAGAGVPGEAGDEWAGAADLDGLEHRYSRGIVVHELLEASARAGWSLPDPARVADLLRREGMPAGRRAVERVVELLRDLLASPLRRELGGARSARPEAPFAFRLGELVVRGEIDLLADLGHEVLVVDYKSDHLGDEDPTGRMDRYEVQRDIYALAALRRHGRPVRVAYVFLERPDRPVERRYEPGDVAALTERLSVLGGDIVAGRFEVTERPGRALCFDCPARQGLCSHPQSVTMAT